MASSYSSSLVFGLVRPPGLPRGAAAALAPLAVRETGFFDERAAVPDLADRAAAPVPAAGVAVPRFAAVAVRFAAVRDVVPVRDVVVLALLPALAAVLLAAVLVAATAFFAVEPLLAAVLLAADRVPEPVLAAARFAVLVAVERLAAVRVPVPAFFAVELLDAASFAAVRPVVPLLLAVLFDAAGRRAAVRAAVVAFLAAVRDAPEAFAAVLAAVPLFFAPVLLAPVLFDAGRAAVLLAAVRVPVPLFLADVLEAGLFAAAPSFIDAGEPVPFRDAIADLPGPAAAPFFVARAMLVLTGVALPLLACAVLGWAVLALARVPVVFDARLAVVFLPAAAARCAFIAAGLTAACVCLAVAMPDRVLPWVAPMLSEDPWGCTRLN